MASRHVRRVSSFADAYMKAHEQAGDEDDDEDEGEECSCSGSLSEWLRMSWRERFMVISMAVIVVLLFVQFWKALSWITAEQQHATGPKFDALVARYLDDRRGDPASHKKTALDDLLARKFNESCVPVGIAHREFALRAPERCLSRADIQGILVNLTLITSAVFTQANITHFLDSGTLLGAVRHSSVIPFDQDVDFGIDERGYEILKTMPILFPSEYELHVFDSTMHLTGSRYLELPVRVIHRPSTLYADVFVYIDSPDASGRVNETGPMASGAYVNCIKCPKAPGRTEKQFKVPYDWIYPVRGCRFAGYDLRCPNKPHEYLVHMFGEDFMEPVVYP